MGKLWHAKKGQIKLMGLKGPQTTGGGGGSNQPYVNPSHFPSNFRERGGGAGSGGGLGPAEGEGGTRTPTYMA